jgi:hypothetical protein
VQYNPLCSKTKIEIKNICYNRAKKKQKPQVLFGGGLGAMAEPFLFNYLTILYNK